MTKMRTWVCPDNDKLSAADREAVCGWLRAHDLDPCRITAVAVFTDEVHVSETVVDEDGEPVVDYAANQRVTWPRVVPLIADPPIEDKHKGGRHWAGRDAVARRSPTYAVSREDAERYRTVVKPMLEALAENLG